MAKIRSLGNRELQQVLSLLERFTGDAFHYPVLERFQSLYLPFHKVNHALPLGMKFLPDIYVAGSDDQVLGLVWLSRDGNRQDRWKIDQVIIDPDVYGAYDTGRQLVYYAINKLGGMGVETFVAYVDPQYAEGLNLLKDCGFRHCAKQHTYQLEGVGEDVRHKKIQIQGIREAKRSDARKLQELHSETLLPELRISLRKSPGDFYPNPWDKLVSRSKGQFLKRWVVSQGSQDYLYGSIGVSTWDYKHYDLSLMVSPAWEHGTEDLIGFSLQQICKSANNPIITVTAYEFQKTKNAVLEQLGFQRQSTTEILVKDYWVAAKDRTVKAKSPVLLFGGGGKTSPA